MCLGDHTPTKNSPSITYNRYRYCASPDSPEGGTHPLLLRTPIMFRLVWMKVGRVGSRRDMRGLGRLGSRNDTPSTHTPHLGLGHDVPLPLFLRMSYRRSTDGRGVRALGGRRSSVWALEGRGGARGAPPRLKVSAPHLWVLDDGSVPYQVELESRPSKDRNLDSRNNGVDRGVTFTGSGGHLSFFPR